MELLKGDCLELMKNIENESIDLILCDLPYGTTDCKWDTIIPFEDLWQQYNRIIKKDGAVVLFSAQPFTTKLINSNIKNYRYSWYWLKNTVMGFNYARYQPMRKVEDINVFYKKHGVYNPQGLKSVEKPKTRKSNFMGEKDCIIKSKSFSNSYTTKYTNFPNNVLNFNKEFGLHPTQKPVPLLEYLIKTYTNENELVLDNCMGSGSTGVACVNTNRRFIGIEKDEKYYEIASQRIKEAISYDKRLLG